MVLTMMATSQKARRAAEVARRIEADLVGGAHRGVIVDSPPGAGKSTLVVALARRLAAGGEPVMVVAQTNEQVDDLVDRLAAAAVRDGWAAAAIGRLSASGYLATPRVARHLGTSVTVGGKVADLGEPAVTVATAAKWARTGGAGPGRVPDAAAAGWPHGGWRWAILDEAYQMRSDGLLAIAPRFADGTALFVGDPGQLDPFAAIDGDRWAGSAWDPTDSAVAVVRAHNPELPVHRLPYSWRLPPSTAPLVSAAFYPFTPFEAGSEQPDRILKLPGGGTGPLDRALDMAAETGWALHELPARYTMRTDAEALEACAALAVRLLERGAVAFDPGYPGGRPVGGDRIAIGAAHRDQVAGIRLALDRRGAAARAVTVDTANRLQGREYDVVIVLHPLSGRRDAGAFHLETGRLCVLLSRHRHACIVVARAGIAELLDAHPHAEPLHLGVPVKFPDGWEAHQAVLAHLSGFRV
jgi:hypothetical protein